MDTAIDHQQAVISSEVEKSCCDIYRFCHCAGTWQRDPSAALGM